jgi:hypothetical protein
MTLAQARCVLGDGKAPTFPGAPGVYDQRKHGPYRLWWENWLKQYEADPWAYPHRHAWTPE